MAVDTVEAFSLTHAQVLDGTTAFANAIGLGEDYDVYGVEEGSLEPDEGSFDNVGDDVVLSTWDWLNKAEVRVRAGYLSFPLISTITGRATESSGAGAAIVFETDLWHEDDFNVAPKPMLLRMPSKDKDGVVRYLDIGLYKVSFSPMTFDGPRYKDGLKIDYSGRAVFSDKDEEGVVFADGKKRIGRLISRPVS